MNKIIRLIIITALLPIRAIADPGMIVEHYTEDNGLPNNIVYSALKDSDGFMWFGTWHGLCTFDGNTFKSFIKRTNHKSDLPPRKVKQIIEDRKGFLWIRDADNHLYLFDRKKETYHDIYNELTRLARNAQIIKIQLMETGRLLMLTRSKEILEARVDKGGVVKISRIYDSYKDLDVTKTRLSHNIIGENSRYIYRLDRSHNIDVIEKKSKQALLTGIGAGKNITGYKRLGRYLCAGTSTGEIYIVNMDNAKTYRHAFKGFNMPVTGIDQIGDKIYFTNDAGLYYFTKGTAPKSVTPNTPLVTGTFVDKYRKLWIYSKKGRLICHDPATSASQTFAMPTDSLFSNMKILDTGAHGLFILQINGEVWRYDHNTRIMQNINHEPEFKGTAQEPHFFDIDISNDGTMWLSSTSSGVYKVNFPRNNFKFIYNDIINLSQSFIHNNGIRSLYQDRKGLLWVGTRYGELYCIDIRNNSLKHKFDKNEIGSVYNIMEDNRGNYWFSTKGAGLVKGKPDPAAPGGLALTRYTNRTDDRNSISSNRVYNTFQDSKGRIWVCTFYGGLNLMEQNGDRTVFRHKRNGFKTYPKYDLYVDIRMITEDKNGRMWVATTDGLMSFDGNFDKAGNIIFETYRGRNNTNAIDNDIYSMYKDHSGNIWMGIFGNGINKLEQYDAAGHRPILKTHNIGARHGGDAITAITEDRNHHLWICTENGLYSMQHGHSFIKSYDRFAGFPEVNIEDNTMARLDDGRILIGCRQGILAFDPASTCNDNTYKHNTYITDFKIGNRELYDFDRPIYDGSPKYARKIELEHNLSTFTIEFSSPYFADNNTLPFTYILDGYEKQWHKSGNDHTASYVNVPPGHYKFRVKVDDGNSPERVLEIVVSPPWWASWWAYTIYAILFITALYGGIRLATYMIRMRNEVYINDRLAELKIRFFTNVSHELRTPLSLINGPIEELKTKEALSPTGRKYIELIDRNARKMLTLVNQILDFRKIQNGKMKMHVSLVDINEIIELLMRDFRMLADERNISFTFDKSEEHIMLWCDAEKIGCVINNLLSNAFKYTNEEGTIRITLEHDHERKTCTIRVEDDGASIPKPQLEVIFERFRQADNRTYDDSVPAGTGIGLSLSKEYITMHHGRIWAENIENGQGVIFSVEIPTGKEHFDEEDIEVYINDNTAASQIASVQPAEPRKEEHTVATAQDKNKPALILIEDNIDLCRMLQMQLQNDYRVFTAHEGGDGLKKIYGHHPDLIITDLMMPGMNGMELLHNVRQDFNISHIPVIMLTAKNTEEDKMKAIKTGANAFITKPFSSSYLMAVINRLLEEQRIFQRKMVVRATIENTGDNNKDEYEQHLVKKDIEFLNKINEIIEQNLNANDFNIDTIAGTIGLSRSSFFKKLKSLTGFAPVDLVREIRLNKAARLIETTSDSITEIAYSVGFRDAGYFGKCFRKKYDMTPKEYRNKKRTEQ